MSEQISEQISKIEPTTKIKAKYAVTFEFPLRLPITIRGEVEGYHPHTLFMRAVVEARKSARKPESMVKYGTIRGWSSISVLIDRFDYMQKDEKMQKEINVRD